ncbi:hypothetical protein GDO86_010809 [Hymenochirus boettgeri]|uniref:Cilia- and flagella-associated protein 418 n=1 Tax=Hymenochirus boettgeri TaxID=247094 RepID=A0A8T2JEQ9_9PIPI|nr:hypothetical protein GDO86_010809 [Hymenochirus boettgeri]
MEEDDLDSLLDEVEQKYCTPGPVGHRSAAGEPSRLRTTLKPSTAEENIDELIEEILDVPCHRETKNEKANNRDQQACNSFNQISRTKKCCPVYIAGSSVPFGVGTNLSERYFFK